MKKVLFWYIGILLLVSVGFNQYQAYHYKELLKEYNKCVQDFNNEVDKK